MINRSVPRRIIENDLSTVEGVGEIQAEIRDVLARSAIRRRSRAFGTDEAFGISPRFHLQIAKLLIQVYGESSVSGCVARADGVAPYL